MSDQQPSTLHFSEQLFSIRAAAGAIYDRGFMAGEKPEEITKKIEPLTQALVRMVERAAKSDIPGCIMAVQRLESQARAHEEDAKFLTEKAANNRHHAESIKKALIEQMTKNNLSEVHVGDFTLVKTKVENREILVLR